MDKAELRVLFMGTPDFAVESLKALVENDFNVVGVVTATDKYGGRGGKQLLESAVKKYADEQQLRVLQPKNLKAVEFHQELQGLKIDIQIVVAFRMLPEIVWDMPRFGTINLHGSLLPKYRGAAPLNWAIIRGERITGVTTFQLKHEIDTGDMILQRELSIGEDENFGSLYERMKILGAETLIETMHLILSDDIQLQPQNSALISNAPKIKKETCEINFHDTVTNAYNFIRGLSPFPCSWFHLDEKEVKVYAAKKILKVPLEKPGNIITDNKKYLRIACLDGYLEIEELKMEGKKKMDIRSFLNGYQIKNLP